jgi:pimeloyl-ACP methyl ester carboxylesterase
VTLNTRSTGNGQPTILFVHGFGCALDDWNAQVAGLSARFRCVALDLPGHGASPLTEPSVAALAAEVNDVRQEIGGKVVLVGHSLGAKVVREACCQSPEGVAGLVLVDGRFVVPGGDLLQRERQKIADLGFATFARGNFSVFFRDGADPALRERVLARAASLDPDFGAALYLDAVAWDNGRSEETLRQIRAPIQVLQSTYTDTRGQRRSIEPGIETPMMAIVRQLHPDADIRIITESGHFTMFDQPEALTRAIGEFAARIARD